MLATLLLFAQEAEEAEPSKAPYYIAAGVLIVFAFGLSFIGTRRHETFPASRGLARGLMLLTALLVAATMFTAVYTG